MILNFLGFTKFLPYIKAIVKRLVFFEIDGHEIEMFRFDGIMRKLTKLCGIRCVVRCGVNCFVFFLSALALMDCAQVTA